MEGNNVKQHQRPSGVPSLGLPDKRAIRTHPAGDHAGGPGEEFRGGFSKGGDQSPADPLDRVAEKSTTSVFHRFIPGDRKRELRVRFHSRLVGDQV